MLLSACANKNKEVNPKHQKQVHEKKRQNICWKQRNIGNKYDLRKKTAFKYYATKVMSDYNVEIDKKVGLGLLNEERANNMKEELSSKVDTLIQMWSEGWRKKVTCRFPDIPSLSSDVHAYPIP